MQQLKNYLSRIYAQTKIKSVLLVPSTDEFYELVPYLVKCMKVEHICILSDKTNNNLYNNIDKNIISCLKYNEISNITYNIDAIIFDINESNEVLKLSSFQPEFLIGRLEPQEDYFGLWERYRIQTSFIYLEYESSDNKNEILEWQKSDSQIELSVILPVYNIEKYIEKCIETIIKWQAPYVEYLFVNDGSTDNSDHIIQKYADTDTRIRLINKENGGCASARNRGIQEAKGKYIGFVDADDFIDPDMFCKLFKRALMGNYEYAYCGYNEYYEDTGDFAPVTDDCLKEPYLTGTYRSDKVQLLTVNTKVAIWRAIYKKSVLDTFNIRFHEDLKRFDDLPFKIEYIFAAKNAVCIPECLYYYRLGRKGQDVSCTDKRLYVHFDIFEHLDKYTKPYKDQRLWDLLQVVKIQTHGYGLRQIDKQYKKEYMKKAKQQLKMRAGYIRNVCLILMHAGKSNLGWFTKLWIKG